MKRLRSIALVACSMALAVGAGAVLAQPYPARPVKLGDSRRARRHGRLRRPHHRREAWRSSRAADHDRQPAGRLDSIGAEAVAKAPPDGYTLLLATSAFTTIPALQPKLGYDAIKDLAPVALVASYPQVLVATAGLPMTSAAGRACARPGQSGSFNMGRQVRAAAAISRPSSSSR